MYREFHERVDKAQARAGLRLVKPEPQRNVWDDIREFIFEEYPSILSQTSWKYIADVIGAAGGYIRTIGLNNDDPEVSAMSGQLLVIQHAALALAETRGYVDKGGARPRLVDYYINTVVETIGEHRDLFGERTQEDFTGFIDRIEGDMREGIDPSFTLPRLE